MSIGLYFCPRSSPLNLLDPFQLAWTKFRKSYETTPGVGVGVGVGVSKKFNVKVFYLMGRRCQASYPVPVTGLVDLILISD